MPATPPVIAMLQPILIGSAARAGVPAAASSAATPHAATYVVPLLGDEYLACAPILGEGTFLSTNGREVYQSTDRLNWGTELAPGTYRAVTTIDEYTPCFAFTATGNTVAVNGVTPPDTVAVVGVP